MIIYKCDRCFDKIEKCMILDITRDDYSTTTKKLHLCMNCNEDFQDFLAKKQIIEERKTNE